MPEAERYQPKDAPADAAVITRDNLSSGGFKYPAKLVECKKVLSEPQDASRKPVQQMYQVFERCDQQWPDGNPVRRYNRLNLQFQSKETGEIETIWEGSDADQVGQAFEDLCGCDMFPDNPDTASFIGHFFMVEDVKIPKTDKLYLRVPTEYLGDDFKFAGKVTTLESQDGAQAAEAPPTDNAEDAARVADLLVGMTEEDVRGGAALLLIQKDEKLKGVTTVLGGSLRGGLVQPKAVLLDRLIAAKFLTIEDGTIMLGAGDES
ncbi:hypothetical protein LCGC14_1125720 [marine sediment metagenome]|uniref:Uncharacterized protein n=1 Tax=marine sediment metagenome TaxID=412755 RepID=A0A0F9M7B4_9ZZZZ